MLIYGADSGVGLYSGGGGLNIVVLDYNGAIGL